MNLSDMTDKELEDLNSNILLEKERREESDKKKLKSSNDFQELRNRYDDLKKKIKSFPSRHIVKYTIPVMYVIRICPYEDDGLFEDALCRGFTLFDKTIEKVAIKKSADLPPDVREELLTRLSDYEDCDELLCLFPPLQRAIEELELDAAHLARDLKNNGLTFADLQND